MRLWHERMIPYLSRQHLLGQHRECCALRGKGWGRKHSVVDYVFIYSPIKLYQYHLLIMNEMKKRNYKPDELWFDVNYRGKFIEKWNNIDTIDITTPIYIEHNDQYLKDCLINLQNKGFSIEQYGVLAERSKAAVC